MTREHAIPFRKCRVEGTFTLCALADGRVRAEFSGSFCGKPHEGYIFLTQRGSGLDPASVHLRIPNSMVDPSSSAEGAISEAAQMVARQWAAAHPELFQAADLDAARSAAERADGDVRELQVKLALAMERAQAAHARVALLEAPCQRAS